MFVLKGGVLYAAFDARRSTRDVDLAGIQIANDSAAVLELARTVLAIDLNEDDGIEFDTRGAAAEVIREVGGSRGHEERLQLNPPVARDVL